MSVDFREKGFYSPYTREGSGEPVVNGAERALARFLTSASIREVVHINDEVVNHIND